MATAGMVLVRSTYEIEEDAAAAAHRLVEERLACCVHIAGIRSIYRWDGAVQDGPEWVLEARTTRELQDAVVTALEGAHPSNTPLVEVLGQAMVPRKYWDWAVECLRAP